jgi:hypothetical protein
MFWTCSRICSISTFMSTEMRVSSSAADFEPSVLASRCSSWIRKSSRLPTSPPFLTSRSISSRCAASRVSSSATSMRMAKAVASVSARSCAASGDGAPSRQAHGLLPAFQEAGALLLHQLAAPAAWPAPASSRSLLQVAQEHVGQPGAFALAGGHQVVRACAGQRLQQVAPSRRGPASSAWPGAARRPRSAPGRRAASCAPCPAPAPAAAGCARRARARRRPGRCFDAGAHFDLAALELGREQLAQAGSCWRSSSDRRKERSRKRLLTERISSPSRPPPRPAFVLRGLRHGLCWPLA